MGGIGDVFKKSFQLFTPSEKTPPRESTKPTELDTAEEKAKKRAEKQKGILAFSSDIAGQKSGATQKLNPNTSRGRLLGR